MTGFLRSAAEPAKSLGQIHLMNPELTRARAEFLASKGWPESVLATSQMLFCPNVSPVGIEPPWPARFHNLLAGHSYRTIPFFGLHGEPLMRVVPLTGGQVQFTRVRLLNYPATKKGKYRSMTGAGIAAYLTPLRGDWADIAANASVPIWLTEGEDKAIEGCRRGRPTIGLTGKDCLASKGVLAEPLDQFVWHGRQVLIVFDQEEESTEAVPLKPSVARSADRCGSLLIQAGATPFNLYIARTRVGIANLGKKLGLDDFYALGGTAEELEATAQPIEQSGDLAYLLLRYAITERGFVLDAQTGELMTVDKFKAANSERGEWVTGGRGGRRFVETADLWKRARSRARIPNDGIILDPTQPSGLIDGRLYNQWQGFTTVPVAIPNAEAIAAFETLGSRMYPSNWPWVRGWHAFMLQSPSVKVVQALICATKVEGIGKSLFSEIMAGIVGPRHARKVGTDKLFHQFGTHISGAIYLYCDELQSGHARHEDLFKDMITSPTWEIERKGVDIITVPNLAHISISTNKPYTTKMGENARRQYVDSPDVSEAEKVASWQPWIHSVALWLKTDPEWRASVMTHLLSLDVVTSGYDPIGDAPWTIHRIEMAQASDSPKEAAAAELWGRLPDTFALTSDMKAQYLDCTGKPDKHVIDLVCNCTPFKVTAIVKLEGRTTNVAVYGKTGFPPYREEARSEGNGVRRVTTLKPDEVKEALMATASALGIMRGKKW